MLVVGVLHRPAGPFLKCLHDGRVHTTAQAGAGGCGKPTFREGLDPTDLRAVKLLFGNIEWNWAGPREGAYVNVGGCALIKASGFQA